MFLILLHDQFIYQYDINNRHSPIHFAILDTVILIYGNRDDIY